MFIWEGAASQATIIASSFSLVMCSPSSASTCARTARVCVCVCVEGGGGGMHVIKRGRRVEWEGMWGGVVCM